MAFNDWWEAKRIGFGPDDGTEFFAAEDIREWIAANRRSGCEQLPLGITPSKMGLEMGVPEVPGRGRGARP